MWGDENEIAEELPEEEERDDAKKWKFRQQAQQVISGIESSCHSGRKVIAKSYRRINRMIDCIERDKFNFNDDIDLVEEVLRSSFFYQPYPIENIEFKINASTVHDAMRYNRRLKPPTIKIAQELINPSQKSVRLNSNQSQVTLKIQTQPFTSILYNNIPNSHPLLIDPLDNPFLKDPSGQYFQKWAEREIIDILNLPCQLNIMTINESKIESKVITLKVISQLSEGEHRQGFAGYAMRPIETFFDQSSHLSGQSPSYSSMEEPQVVIQPQND